MYAINFLKSTCDANEYVVAIKLIITICIISVLLVLIKKYWNLSKPTNAVLTKTPLRNIEKLVFASTCVFINQKLNGHSGSFILKPINSNHLTNNLMFVGIILVLNINVIEFVYLYKTKIAIHKKNELNCVQNKKYNVIIFDLILGLVILTINAVNNNSISYDIKNINIDLENIKKNKTNENIKKINKIFLFRKSIFLLINIINNSVINIDTYIIVYI